jgi:hypothetical protein
VARVPAPPWDRRGRSRRLIAFRVLVPGDGDEDGEVVRARLGILGIGTRPAAEFEVTETGT